MQRPELADSPMFQLSLSARELFHSNFLAWLLEKYPALLQPLFGPSIHPDLTLVPPSSRENTAWVRREYLNMDLCLELDVTWLVIENKVKSVPRSEQLREYEANWEAKQRKKLSPKPVCWLLLTLTESDHEVLREMEMTGGCAWQGITYVQIAERLRRAMTSQVRDAYHVSLMADWARSVEVMAEVAGAKHRDWPHATAMPRGLNDLIWKRAASQASRALAVELRKRLAGIEVTCDLPLPELRPRTCNVYSNLTRGTGLFGFSIVFDPMRLRGVERTVSLGVQVQAGRFKCYVEFQIAPHPADAPALRDMAMHLFDVGSNNLRIPCWGGTSKKGVGTYSGNHYYRSQAIGREATIEGLVGQLAASASAIARITPRELQRALSSQEEDA